jgi:pimeloyl-ACP methyl ester carboxylesterase
VRPQETPGRTKGKVVRTKTHLFLAAIILFGLPGASVCQTNDSATYPPPGKLVNIGGRLLHLNCAGKRNPTIVTESGAGDFSFDWGSVQPAVARFARICTYDRAGYAWSEPGPTPRTMHQIALELHTALLKAGIRGPYILVGHSLGGAIVRTYAGQYPREVAGMVLVDAVHEEGLISITDRTTKREKIVRWRELSRGRQVPPVQEKTVQPLTSPNPQGGRASSSTQSPLEAPYDKLPLTAQQMRVWAKSQPHYNPARFSEFDFLPEELDGLYSQRQSNKRPLGRLPLIVLTPAVSTYEGADEQTKERLDEDHKRLQANLLSLSSNSKQIIARNSGHHIQIDEPGLAVNAIREVFEAARRRIRLKAVPAK